ncbi:MAG: hypothetical protein V4508_03210 [Pseudomonadota bacterium]
MSKHTSKPNDKPKQEAERLQQDATRNQQRAETDEVAGRHKNDGQKDHKGADKGPRHQ